MEQRSGHDDDAEELPLELLDQLGEWSQIKHEILDKYAHAYTTILTNQRTIKRAIYIDAYAGCGFALDRETGETLRGSAIRAVDTIPPFNELHFIEEDRDKARILRRETADDRRVTVHDGDGAAIITRSLLQRCRYRDFHRALCLLDPYDLSVPWTLVHAIGQERSMEIFYTFMIMDANRNVLWRQPERVAAEQLARMDLVWGDRSWQKEIYPPTLFDDITPKVPNYAVAAAFRRRLQEVAGFEYVPEPIAMKNDIGATVYYLFFATHNQNAAKIVTQILKPYAR